MQTHKYQISISTSLGITSSFDFNSYDDFILYIKKEGMSKFSLINLTSFDDTPTLYKSGLSITELTNEYFMWLNGSSKEEARTLRIDLRNEKSKVTEFDYAVFDCIRKSIYRFRKHPLLFFTESDIHAYFLSDLKQNNSEYFIHSKKHISLIHLEYPTNFRYRRNDLINGNSTESSKLIEETSIRKDHGDRGNFDVAILNPEFIDAICKWYPKDEYIAHAINKDKNRVLLRLDNINYNHKVGDAKLTNYFQREIKYAIEFKYIHQFNAINKNMLEEVVKDNEKLRLGLLHSNYYLRPINLVFCSTFAKVRSDKEEPIILRIKNYINNGYTTQVIKDKTIFIRAGILNIFIESYFNDAGKTTENPFAFCKNPQQWAIELCDKMNIKLITEYTM
jgi:hypothetical protein